MLYIVGACLTMLTSSEMSQALSETEFIMLSVLQSELKELHDAPANSSFLHNSTVLTNGNFRIILMLECDEAKSNGSSSTHKLLESNFKLNCVEKLLDTSLEKLI